MPNLTLPAQVEHALEVVISYIWREESLDYELCSAKQREQHIFKQLLVLNHWLSELQKTGVAEPSDPGEEPGFFGGCPHCHRDGNFRTERSQWFFCRLHRVKWCIGPDMFRSRREGTEEHWKTSDFLADFKEVRPVFASSRCGMGKD